MRGGLKNKAVFFSSKFVPFTITQGLLVRYNRLVLGYTVGVGITVATCSEKTKETRRFVLGLWLQFESPSSMFPNTVVRMWSHYFTTWPVYYFGHNRQRMIRERANRWGGRGMRVHRG